MPESLHLNSKHHSVNQPIDRSIDQLVDRLINHTIIQPANHSNQSISRSFHTLRFIIHINYSHDDPNSSTEAAGSEQGLAGGLVTLQMMLEGTGLKGGVDILAGPLGEKSLDLPPLDEMTPERIAALGRQTQRMHVQEMEEEEEEEGEEREEEAEGEEGTDPLWDEDEWDEGLGAMGAADPLGDVGWDVAERFEVLINELLATPSPDVFHSIGGCGGGEGGLGWWWWWWWLGDVSMFH
jgi:hypothetical protein